MALASLKTVHSVYERLYGLSERPFELEPYDLKETGDYVSSRIRTAGGEPSQVFSREAIMLIHRHSGGIPRTINVICDNALLAGLALEQRPVNQATIREVCRDLRLDAQ